MSYGYEIQDVTNIMHDPACIGERSTLFKYHKY